MIKYYQIMTNMIELLDELLTTAIKNSLSRVYPHLVEPKWAIRKILYLNFVV